MRARYAIPALALAWAVVASILGLWKWAIFRAGVDDGIFTQVLLSLTSGFHSTVESNVNHFLIHFSPILVVLAPFVRIVGDARALIVAQAILHALVVFPVYGIARRRCGETASIAIAAASLLYPVLWAAAFTDFHENAFVPVLSAWLCWALDGRRLRLAWVPLVALFACKEDQSVLLFGVGAIVALVWRSERPMVRFGIMAMCASAASGIIYFAIVRNMFPFHIHYWPADDYFSTGPGATWNDRAQYLFWAFAPLAFLPLRSRFVLFTIPGFVEVLASHGLNRYGLGTHYVAGWLGYMLAANAASIGDIIAARRRWSTIALPLAAATSLLTLFFHDPMARWYFLYRLPNAHDATLESLLRTLPQGATIGSEDEIFAHLAGRSEASLGPNGQEYFVYDRTHYSDQWKNTDEPKLRASIISGAYRVVRDKDGIVVVKRVGSHS